MLDDISVPTESEPLPDDIAVPVFELGAYSAEVDDYVMQGVYGEMHNMLVIGLYANARFRNTTDDFPFDLDEVDRFDRNEAVIYLSSVTTTARLLDRVAPRLDGTDWLSYVVADATPFIEALKQASESSPE